jgi:hypothetical protein
MSVGVELGFAVEGPVPVSSATWSRWGAQHSVLARFEGAVAMRAWLRTADRPDAEAALWALAQLGPWTVATIWTPPLGCVGRCSGARRWWRGA